MKDHTKKIKIFFSVTVFVVGIIMIYGSFLVYGITPKAKKIFLGFYHFAEYSFSFESNNILLASINNFSDQDEKEGRMLYGVELNSLPILLYHGIIEKADRFNMTKETFKDQMFALKKEGYQTVTLQDLEDFRNGKKTLPPKSFMLTFDDGRLDSYLEVDPLLRALDYTAVMFVATDASVPPEDRKKSTYYISKDDIESMLDSGRWEIGSHAVQKTGGLIPVTQDGKNATFLSNKMWLATEGRLETEEEYRKRVVEELGGSKLVLENTFNVKVNSFSYPFGDFGQQSVNGTDPKSYINKILKQNYFVAFKQVWPNDGDFYSNYPNTDPYKLKRIEVPTNWSGEELLNLMSQIKDKNISFKDAFDFDSGWKRTWGTFSLENNILKMRSTASTTGAFVFLDGTGSWKNYIYFSNLDWVKGSHVSLVARYKDGKNYQACVFSKDTVRIESVVGGEVKKLSEVKHTLDTPSENLNLGVVVVDDFMKCFVGKSVLTYATIPLEEGGIGVKIWDKTFDNAEIHLKKILIEDVVNSDSVLSNIPKYLLK